MPASSQSLELAQLAASAAEDKLATDLVALDVSGQFPFADVFLLASAGNERQIPAIVDAVDEALHRAGHRIVRREGDKDDRWVLLDTGDIIVHVQHEEERDFYRLERLWKDCPAVPLRLGDASDDASTDAAREGDGSEA